jgi:general stress protein CsbA
MQRWNIVKAAFFAVMLSILFDEIHLYTPFWFVNPIDLLVLY